MNDEHKHFDAGRKSNNGGSSNIWVDVAIVIVAITCLLGVLNLAAKLASQSMP